MNYLPLSIFEMILLSVREPSKAAALLIKENYPTIALWMVLGLLSIANVGFMTLSGAVFGSMAGQLEAMNVHVSPLFFNPIFFCFMMFALSGIYYTVLHRLSLGFNAQERFAPLLTVMVWVEFLRVISKFALLLVMLALPFVSGFLNLALLVLEFVITLVMINEATQVKSVFKSFLLVLFASIILILALSTILLFTGLISVG